MRTKELIEYLQTFPEYADITVIVADVKNRVKYDCLDFIGITDADHPVFCVEIGNAEPFDDELIKVTEECERIDSRAGEDDVDCGVEK